MLILQFFLGIALFLFGMNLMSEHLQKIAGNQTEQIIYRLTKRPIQALLIGVGATALLQSSSAVCAMIVSLTHSRIIHLKQSISITLGSILGTAVTGWIIAYSAVDIRAQYMQFFSAQSISAFFAIIGIFLKLFIKKCKLKRFGEILLGFSVLMLGIHIISIAVQPLQNNTSFINTIAAFQQPFILFFIGIILSAILQSASASVGILQTLSITGIMRVNNTLPILLGIGIGASLPVLLSAIGKSIQAKQAAFSYLVENSLGAAIIGLIYFFAVELFKLNINPKLGVLEIAALNTSYRLTIIIILFPLLKYIEKLCTIMIRSKKRSKPRQGKIKSIDLN